MTPKVLAMISLISKILPRLIKDCAISIMKPKLSAKTKTYNIIIGFSLANPMHQRNENIV